MFKRKINLKRARKLADYVPGDLKLNALFLSEGHSHIVSVNIPIFSMNSLNRNHRRYPSLNNKSTW